MKKYRIIKWILLSSILIFMIQLLKSLNIQEKIFPDLTPILLRYLSNDQSKSEQFKNNSTFIFQIFKDLDCNQLSPIQSLPVESSRDSTIKKYKTWFQEDTKLGDIIEQFLSGQDETTNEWIWQIAKIIAPLLCFFCVVLICWFTYCSCCCYDYCPIICRREDLTKPYSYSEKYVPVVIMIFAAASLFIPIVLSYMNFENMIHAFKFALCKWMSGNYTLKQGKGWNDTSTVYIGYEDHDKYFKVIQGDDFVGTWRKFEQYVNDLQYQKDDIANRVDRWVSNAQAMLIKKPIFGGSREQADFTKWPIIADFQNFEKIYFDRYNTIVTNMSNTIKAMINDRGEYVKLFDEINQVFNKDVDFNSILSFLVNFFHYIIHDLKFWWNAFKISWIVSQLIVITISSWLAIIIFLQNTQGKNWIGHCAWCLSSTSIFWIAIVMILFYSLGCFLINSGTFLQNNSSLTGPEIVQKELDIDINWIHCLNQFSVNSYYSQYQTQIDRLNEFSVNLLKFKIFKAANPFEQTKIIKYITDLVDYAFNENNVFHDTVGNDGINPWHTALRYTNSIVDFRSTIPTQYYYQCTDSPTSYELYTDITNCTYGYYSQGGNILDDEIIKNGKVCWKIDATWNWDSIFRSRFSNCFAPQQTQNWYDHLVETVNELQQFNEQYTWFKNQVFEDLSATAMWIIKENKRVFERIQVLNDQFIDEINSFLRFPLEERSEDFLKQTDYSASDLLEESTDIIKMNFMEFTSCSFFHDISLELVNTMLYEICSAIYVVIIVYIFLLCYNALTAIFGWSATLINFSPLALEDNEFEDEWDDDAEEELDNDWNEDDDNVIVQNDVMNDKEKID